MGQYTRQINTMFVMLQTILYVAFLTIDLTGGSVALSSNIKFSIIILCFCYALFSRNGANKSILFCLKGALLFTLVSDLFILILDYYFYGVLTFILVQQLYGIRLSMVKGYEVSKNRQVVLIRGFLYRLALMSGVAFMICFVLWKFGVAMESLLIASIFYFSCILTNAITGLKAAITNPKDKGLLLFAVGMLLFLFCDINVGLFNISGYISLPKDFYKLVYSMSSILMWTFYAPAQVLIALSVEKSNTAI